MGDRSTEQSAGVASALDMRQGQLGPTWLDVCRPLGDRGRMNELLVGYARVSTEQQDLTAQRIGLNALGVGDDRIYVDHGLTGANRDRPGLRLALAAGRAGDTLVVTKLDRLARWLPDARDILDELTRRNVKLSLGGSIHDPTDPVGRLLFKVLAMVAEFESDPDPTAHPRRNEGSQGKGSAARQAAEAETNQASTCWSCTTPGPTPKLSSPNFSVSGDPRSIGPSSGCGLNPSNPSGHSYIVPSSLNTQISAPQKFQSTE